MRLSAQPTEDQLTGLTCVDLFAGGGGAGLGYRRAGFDRVIGIDVMDFGLEYESWGGEFHKMKWEEGLAKFADVADMIHASPPCHRYSQMTKSRPGLSGTKPDLIGPVREALIATGKPYVIENVEKAPLLDPTMLCCWSFGYQTYRHRLFETSHPIEPMKHYPHDIPGSRSGHWVSGTFISVAGHCSPIWKARQVMGINWMRREELVEAIPPYMSEYVGRQMIRSAGLE